MSGLAIKAENIGKRYLLRHNAQKSDSLIGAMAGGVKRVFRKEGNKNFEEFWALKDVSFEVKQGDRVGIVGRNGAGKSTLLKILSRIVKPTTGHFSFEGRIASLLEVGTGFHGDLSGRENIYLNGSILGMSRNEIDRKFDEIVAFSEVEQFLDTPVKKYSSGMYVRLAFAVAAHLEPEILIVDEVLAVGDAAFQKKCIGKMNEISKSDGRTILFVSHSMQSIQKICNTGLFLKNGMVADHGPIERIVQSYLQSGEMGRAVFEIAPAPGLPAHVTKVVIEDPDGEMLHEIPVGTFWRVRIFFTVVQTVEQFIVGFGIVSAFDQPIRTSWSESGDVAPGNYEMTFTHDDVMLTTGLYKMVIGLSSNVRTFQYIDSGLEFAISDAGAAAADKRIINTQSGLILNPMKVNLQKI